VFTVLLYRGRFRQGPGRAGQVGAVSSALRGGQGTVAQIGGERVVDARVAAERNTVVHSPVFDDEPPVREPGPHRIGPVHRGRPVRGGVQEQGAVHRGAVHVEPGTGRGGPESTRRVVPDVVPRDEGCVAVGFHRVLPPPPPVGRPRRIRALGGQVGPVLGVAGGVFPQPLVEVQQQGAVVVDDLRGQGL